jgi:hypothetical protein
MKAAWSEKLIGKQDRDVEEQKQEQRPDHEVGGRG